MKTKKVDEKEFKSMPNCTGAFRYMDHYYCFHGHQFSKFDPVTGEVHGKYPKETRDYFMRCPHFGKCNNEHASMEKLYDWRKQLALEKKEELGIWCLSRTKEH